MCNPKSCGKQDENNLILKTSKEHLLNDKQSWPYLLKKEIFTCKHVNQDNLEYIL